MSASPPAPEPRPTEQERETQPHTPRVLVAIVNYRVSDYTSAALRSLSASRETLDDFGVCVVDNDSRDGSYESLRALVKEQAWDWVSVYQAPRNGGFAYGNNLAIVTAAEHGWRPDYVYLLNPDARVFPDTISQMVLFMDRHVHVGIAGNRVLNEDGSVRPSAWRFHSFLGEFERGARSGPITKLLSKAAVHVSVPDRPGPMDWVSGAGMMVRREVIDDVGLMDEGYFLYYEETDWCLRALRAGWPTWQNPDSVIIHSVGKSTNATGAEAKKRRVPDYLFESRRRFFTKNHGRYYARVADAAWLAGEGIWRARCMVQRRDRDEAPSLLRDFCRNAFTPLGSLTTRPETPALVRSEGRHGRGGPHNAPPLADGSKNRNPQELHFIDLLWEDFATHDFELLSPGFLALAVHRFGNLRMDVRPKLARAPLSVAYKVWAGAIRNFLGIKLDYTVKVGRRVRIWHHGGMVLGAREIGNDVHVRQNTTFGVSSRAYPWAKPIIEDGVDIGAGACIVGHSRVGHHSSIGANSVVSRDVPPFSIVRGPRSEIARTRCVQSALGHGKDLNSRSEGAG